MNKKIKCPHCGKEINACTRKCQNCGQILSAQQSVSSFERIDLPRVNIPEIADIVISGRYRIKKELGRGGMGVVLLARDMELDTDVAVKLLTVDFLGDKQALEELRSEARLAMSLSHPNIVRLHTLETSGQSKFLVMEYVDGLSLADLVDKKRKIPLDEVINYMHDACVALEYAHSQNIVHRDIKPANFLLDKKRSLKLTDFGIAQKVRNALGAVTQKVIMGTPVYMSPEQLLGRRIDYRSDIFSLGSTIYELLTGLPPFISGRIETQIMLEEPEPIGNIPVHVNKAIMKALRKEPTERWQSAMSFYEGLTGETSKKGPTTRKALQWPQTEATVLMDREGPYRVLIVDDEEDIRLTIQAILTHHEYEVDTAFDGQDALDKITQSNYDLVVLDIMMPRLDGIQTLCRLRQAGSDIPVLMLTALGTDKHILQGYRSGANYYMVKPFSTKKLIAASRYLMGDFSTEKEKLDLERLLQ